MATVKAFFISETYLKDNSPLNANVDVSEIYPFAKSAEDMYIQEAIGTCLYDYLKQVVIDSKASPPTAISTVDSNLIKKIRDGLVWLTLYDALPFIHIKVRNIGVVKQNGENLETSDRADVSYLRNIAKQKGDFYMRRLQDFLCENREDYAEYYCTNWDCSKLSPNTNVSNSLGIVLDKPYEDNIYLKYFRP